MKLKQFSFVFLFLAMIYPLLYSVILIVQNKEQVEFGWNFEEEEKKEKESKESDEKEKVEYFENYDFQLEQLISGNNKCFYLQFQNCLICTNDVLTPPPELIS